MEGHSGRHDSGGLGEVCFYHNRIRIVTFFDNNAYPPPHSQHHHHQPRQANPTPPTSPTATASLSKKRAQSPSLTSSPSSPSSSPPPPPKRRVLLPSLPDETALLLTLKDTQNLPWPRVHTAFAAHGWERKLAVLKGRYKAIKEGGVYWEEDDVDLLFRAVWEVEREFERGRWEAVAEKVRGWGGCGGRVGSAECERRWKKGGRMEKEGEGEGEKVEEGQGKGREDVMKVGSLLG
ncbi:unnamed protein product [Tuber melanosporum]|uniref:(Perigord truffle) hypothetical protein n=1 Tax=Tuber melanosporum (strain Mel28) TaxID=656061 RepID=D5G649_TUBMM|nr:uncharacterized protein GSTUM_00001769001 [Tuber melanosporum]CAZ79992.1 unnamed protein product [Tuber melanosporum]